MVHAIDQASPAPLRDCCPGLDPALVATVERAMARQPEHRFASAGAMSAALRAGAGPSAGVTDAPTAVAATTVVGRHRFLALGTVAGLAVALIAIAGAIGGDDPETSPRDTPAVTGPAPTVLSPPSSENRTSTSTATTQPAGKAVKGKPKGKD